MDEMRTTGSTGAPGTDRCSACGRSAEQVKQLLEGRSERTQVRICDRCVREVERVIADSPTRIPGGTLTCGYCTKADGQVAVIAGVGAKLICDECVDAYRRALEPPPA